MVWANIAMAAVNVIESYNMAGAKFKHAKAQYKLEEGRAQNKQLIQHSNNLFEAATANLNRYQQQRDNAKKMDAGAEALRQDTWNYGKQIDGMNSGRFEQRVQAAGALGSLMAQAAFAGVGGSTVDMVADTEAMRQARSDQAIADQIKDAGYVHALNQTSIIDNTFSSLDDSYIFAGLDYSPKDLVFDQSWEHKFTTTNLVLGTGPAMKAAVNGFSGNMDAVGINVGGMMGGMGKMTSAAGSMFSSKGGAQGAAPIENWTKPSGGGATRL